MQSERIRLLGVAGAPVLLVLTSLATAVSAQAFAPVITTPMSYYGMRWATLTDLDRDGNPDLVMVDGSFPTSRFAYHYGTGTGNFGPRLFQNTIPLATNVTSADMNLDGRPDLIVSGPSFTRVHYGTLGGQPGGAVAIPTVLAPVVVDIDADGAPDLVGSQSGVAGCRVVFGDGQGGFPRTQNLTLTPGFLPDQILAGDIDGDGEDEVVFTFGNSVGYYMQVLDHQGSGAVLLQPSVLFGTTSPSRGAIEDWDRDGVVDLLLGFGTPQQPSAVMLFPGGTLGLGTGQQVSVAPSAVRKLFVTDLDGDGVLDLIASASGDLVTARGRGDGTVYPWVTHPGHPITFPDLVDVTRDGFPDLVQVMSNTIEVHSQSGVLKPGVTPFGSGSPPCVGAVTVGVDSTPVVGNIGMRVRFANVPPFAMGLVTGGGPQNVAGYLHNEGMLLHTGQVLSITLGLAHADGSGVMSMPLPVPNTPGLQGTTVHVQGVFQSSFADGRLCEAAPNGLVSSLGLTIIVQ